MIFRPFSRVLATLAFGASVLFSLPALADDDAPVVAHTTVKGHDVPVYLVGEVEAPATAGGVDDFAVRMAYVLKAWTADHRVEAIANLCRTPDGSRFGAVILTIKAHASSPQTDACPAGFVMTGANIHSHPQNPTYAPNAIDRLFLMHPDVERVGTEPDTFSDADYKRPGYMVGAHALHFQNGPGTARDIWDMSKPNPYPQG